MKFLVIDHNNVLLDIWKELNKRGCLVEEWQDADRIVLWQDITWRYVGIVTLAKEHGKKVFIMQHGREATKDYLKHPLRADKIMVWGLKDKELMDSLGYGDKTVLTGTTIFNHLIPKEKTDIKTITFAVDNPIREDDKKIMMELMGFCKQRAWRLIIKTTRPITLPNAPCEIVCSNTKKNNHLGIVARTLALSDVVIVGRGSTLTLLAMKMEIPVIPVHGETNIKDVISQVINPPAKNNEQTLKDYGGVGVVDNPFDNIMKEIYA